MKVEANIVEQYADSDIDGRIEILIRYYPNFIRLVEAFEQSLSFIIKQEKEMKRRSSLGKVPKEVSKLLKELLKLPIFEKIPKDYEEAERIYSEWIQKIFENSECKDEDGEAKIFDLHEVIESLSNRAFSESTPVIINECIVRSFYFIKKLIIEVRSEWNLQKFFEYLENADWSMSFLI